MAENVEGFTFLWCVCRGNKDSVVSGRTGTTVEIIRGRGEGALLMIRVYGDNVRKL